MGYERTARVQQTPMAETGVFAPAVGLVDENKQMWLILKNPTPGAVNYLTTTQGLPGAGVTVEPDSYPQPSLYSTAADTNVDLTVRAKAAGTLHIGQPSGVTALDGLSITAPFINVAGVVSAGNISVAGAGTIGGNLLVSGNETVTGALSAGSIVISGSGTFSSLTVTGAASILNLNVTGASTAVNLVVSNTTTALNLVVTSSASVLNLSGTGAASLSTLVITGGATSGMRLPIAAGAAPTSDGYLSVNTTTHRLVYGFNGATETVNPMTTAGDLFVGGASGAATRLALGTALQLLRVNAGATAAEWGSYFTVASNILGSPVALNNTGTYFDGPSMAQGTAGTWFVIGGVTLVDTSGASIFEVKMWDGTTVISSGRTTSLGASNYTVVTLAGVLASPAANIRISVEDASTVSGSIASNGSGNSKDSWIFGIRIA